MSRRAGRGVALALGALVLAAGAVTASCGIPQDDAPQVIAQESIPQALKEPSTKGTTLATSATKPATLFFVKKGSSASSPDTLAEVRDVPVLVPPVTDQFPLAVLEALLEGPTEEQGRQQLITTIPEGVVISDAHTETDPAVLIIDTSGLFQVSGETQRFAAAQIVFTATALPNIREVVFRDNGNPTAILIENASAEAGQPIGRADYPSLLRDLNGAGSATTTTSTEAPTPAVSEPVPGEGDPSGTGAEPSFTVVTAAARRDPGPR